MKTSLLHILSLAAIVGTLTSCSLTSQTTDGKKSDNDNKESQPKGILSQLTEGEQGFSNPEGFIPAGLMSGGNSAQAKVEEAQDVKEILAADRNKDIVFTDPDNPYADIKELDDAFNAQNERAKQWQQSFSKALRDARRSGKPILIWFHDSKYSPASQLISNELFRSSKFESWAGENLVRVCYDKSATYEQTPTEKQQDAVVISDLTTKRREYVQRAFSHYGVKGTPNVIVLTPDGRLVNSWKGYSGGNSKSVMDRIKQDVESANRQFESFKGRLRDSGFRDWTGKNGTKIFAKFVRYDKKKNMVWLKEFDGTQFSSSLNLLSDEDRTYVEKRQ